MDLGVITQDLARASVDATMADAIKRRKSHLAMYMGIKRGILTQRMPVVEIGCQNPYLGLLQVLRRAGNWKGRYIGIDNRIPADAVESWRQRQAKNPQKHLVALRTWSLEIDPATGVYLPLPPTPRHPFKMVGVAFCIDALKRIQNREGMIWDLKRVAGQIVVVGGATEEELSKWDFQIIGVHHVEGVPEAWGIWLDLRSERIRRIKDRFPDTRIGFFDAGGRGMLPRQLGVCLYCGETNFSGKSKFVCANPSCGKVNEVRRKA